jgi:hypothetical protein
MKCGAKLIICMFLVLLPRSIRAQGEPGNDDPSIASNLGFTIGAPLNPTARYVNKGWGLDAGVGYNFDRRNAVIGEFMWNWLTPTDGALQPVRAGLQSPNITGNGNLFSLTANYKFELRGKRFGAYFIGGGGWYYRATSFSKSILTSTGITCDPAWLWWGFTCSHGTVNTNVSVTGTSSSAFGANGGIGFTIRFGEAPNRFYTEARYHYAPSKDINTHVIAITVGIRY